MKAYSEAMEALASMLTLPFWTTIATLASPSLGNARISVNRFTRCKKCRLRLDKDKAVHIEGESFGPTRNFDLARLDDLDLEIPDDVRRIDASDVVFTDYDPTSSAFPDKVMIQDGAAFFKPLTNFKPFELFRRDVRVLVHLHQRQLSARIPRLIAVVTLGDRETVVGVLSTWITGRKLAHMTVSQRHKHTERWHDQVMETVRALHDANVIWGDVNAHNVMIDEDNNAWVVDTDGGWQGRESELRPGEVNKIAEKRAISRMFDTMKDLSPEESL